ncbi:hypothetical protein DFR24_4880 [Panacagrimonas perspica]|uniref:Uncharacterized protein n=1 Tax=Panacagrimonas perspica TaxID=381431 RepID=A0A4R7NNY2_9GAMM|nr:hypothetical protein [Panacagrimonas perspica]TDU22447.1 hypothetical protein DFR24_4880 [Panacagrimonas perspica]THD01420.1 hypothetical protein B1810_19960 [Panacagrimonas perspica]
MNQYSAAVAKGYVSVCAIRWWANYGLALCGADYAVPADDELAHFVALLTTDPRSQEALAIIDRYHD